MKQIILIFSLLFGGSTLLHAQDKIGYINVNQVIGQELQLVNMEVEKFEAELDAELKPYYESWRKGKATAEEIGISIELIPEMSQLAANIEHIRSTAYEEFQPRYDELMKPVYDYLGKVEQYAQANNFDIIFDISNPQNPAVIYTNPALVEDASRDLMKHFN